MSHLLQANLTLCSTSLGVSGSAMAPGSRFPKGLVEYLCHECQKMLPKGLVKYPCHECQKKLLLVSFVTSLSRMACPTNI